MKLTRLVASTKLSERDFWNRSLLGKSLLAFPEALRPELWIRFENSGKWGLPEIYNRAIEGCPDDKHLLFVHDDVFLHDSFLQYRIAEGLGRAEVVGLAGSRGSDLSQPSWGLGFDSRLKPTGWQSGEGLVLSGAVSHISRYHDPAQEIGVLPKPNLSLYGGMPERCDLLDGLFLAVNASVLREWGVRFDERFRFHLYDLDFCRTVKLRHLRMSTWPILVSHGSGGNFDSEDFRREARVYLDKWKNPVSNDVRMVPADGRKIVGDFDLPHLVECDYCKAAILPANLVAHAVWHRDQRSKALSELAASDSEPRAGGVFRDDGVGTPSPEPHPASEGAGA